MEGAEGDGFSSQKECRKRGACTGCFKPAWTNRGLSAVDFPWDGRVRRMDAPAQSGLVPRKDSWAACFAPVDGASLAVFRIAFGLLMCADLCAYLANGWVDDILIRPSFHFTYLGFDWVKPLPGNWTKVECAVLAGLSLCIALGLFHRVAALLFFIGFTHLFLIDAAEYLNHFYLICLFAFLLVFVPAHRCWSLDTWRKPGGDSGSVPAWCLWLVRAKVGIPYVYGGIAKLNGDWLRGEPLRMWLEKRSGFPIIGRWFGEEWMVYFFSYSGLLLDLLFVPFLLWKPTRLWAYLVVIAFNLMNAALFHIGVFPWMMIAASLLFFPPDWPRWRCRGREIGWKQTSPGVEPRAWFAFAAGVLFIAWQLLMPLRHFLIPGNVAWTEEGHRFSWRMKLRDKQSETSFEVTDPTIKETWEIVPGDFLTKRQEAVMAGHPDMIHQFAIHVARQYEKEYGMRVEVRAKALASLNGRKPAVLIDPTVNLAAETRNVFAKRWITPMPPR